MFKCGNRCGVIPYGGSDCTLVSLDLTGWMQFNASRREEGLVNKIPGYNSLIFEGGSLN